MVKNGSNSYTSADATTRTARQCVRTKLGENLTSPNFHFFWLSPQCDQTSRTESQCVRITLGLFQTRPELVKNLVKYRMRPHWDPMRPHFLLGQKQGEYEDSASALRFSASAPEVR